MRCVGRNVTISVIKLVFFNLVSFRYSIEVILSAEVEGRLFMRKAISFFLMGLIFVVLSFGCCVQPMTASGRASLLDNETVALIHSWHGSTHVFCSGVWVSPTVIMTAEHCVKGLAHRMSMEKAVDNGANPLEVAMGLVELPKIEPDDIMVPFMVKGEITGLSSEPSGMHLTRVLALGGSSDLALLQAINPDVLPFHTFALLPAETPAVGEKIFIVGHPHGLFWTHSEGNVGAYRGDMNEPGETVDPVLVGPFLQVDAAIYKGNSGGGAFNDRGELVGICSFTVGVPNAGFFVHLDSIKAIMKEAHLIKFDLVSKK